MAGEAHRVLVAERLHLRGVALGAGIDAAPDFTTVGTSGTHARTLELAATLDPDIVVIDSGLPTERGLITTRTLKQWMLPPAVILIDDEPCPATVVDAIDAGADGYITRDASLGDLVAALGAIAHGEISVPRGLHTALVRGLRQRRRRRDRISQLYARLTRREREVVELLADGLDHETAADVLSISPETVRTHIQNLLRKLEVHSRLEAAAIARYQRRRSWDVA